MTVYLELFFSLVPQLCGEVETVGFHFVHSDHIDRQPVENDEFLSKHNDDDQLTKEEENDRERKA